MPIGMAVERLRERFPEERHSGTFRFLEREGLLESERTPGGHRLYSDPDLAPAALIKTWQQQGSSIEKIRQRLALHDSLRDPVRLSTKFLELVEGRQLDEGRLLILDAARAGVDSKTIFFDVLKPALVTVGCQWESGELPVHQEKAISEVCRELVTAITIRNSPDYPPGPLLIAACVEGERHEIGLRMVCGLLRQQGYRVRYLGPDVKASFLVDSVKAHLPEAVLLTSSVEESFDGCLAAVTALDDLSANGPGPVVVVGGPIVEHQREMLELVSAFPASDEQVLDHLAELLVAHPQG